MIDADTVVAHPASDSETATPAARVIGRVAFWLLLPGLIANLVGIGLLLDRTFHPGYGAGTEEYAVWVATVMGMVLLASMTFQALLIVRRPQMLTTRQLPARIAVLQLILYAVFALWVVLLVQFTIGLLSVLFGLALMALSIALLILIRAWRPSHSTAATEVTLRLALRVALWAYCLIALVGLIYAVASSLDPVLDPGANQAFVVFQVLGLPLSIMVFPIAVVALLAGYSIALTVAASIPVLLNIAAALLVLAPGTRVPLVNWFFRLGRA